MFLDGSTYANNPEDQYSAFWGDPEDRENVRMLWETLCGLMAGHAAEMSLLDEELESDGIDATDTDAYIERVRKNTLLLDDASGSDLFRTELYAAPLAMFLFSDKGKSLEWTREYREKIEGRDSLAAVFLEEAWDSMYMDDVAYLTDALIGKFKSTEKVTLMNGEILSGVAMTRADIESAIESGRAELIKIQREARG